MLLNSTDSHHVWYRSLLHLSKDFIQATSSLYLGKTSSARVFNFACFFLGIRWWFLLLLGCLLNVQLLLLLVNLKIFSWFRHLYLFLKQTLLKDWWVNILTIYRHYCTILSNCILWALNLTRKHYGSTDRLLLLTNSKLINVMLEWFALLLINFLVLSLWLRVCIWLFHRASCRCWHYSNYIVHVVITVILHHCIF